MDGNVEAVNIPETRGTGWTLRTDEATAQLVLSQSEIVASQIPAGTIAGFSVVVNALPNDAALSEEIVQPGKVLVVEVNPDSPASLARLDRFRAIHPAIPIIGCVRDSSLHVVKTLLKAGLNDVIGLPLMINDLSAALDQVRRDMATQSPLELKLSKLVSIVGSVGGVGATMLATQAASLHARRDAEFGRQTCLFDLDLQFGAVSTYLGLHPKLTVQDLLQAGARVDGELLRATCVRTKAGLHVIAAPTEIIPLESVSADQILNIVELSAAEFDTVYIDLPGNWTNWSLSLIARSNVVLLVVETTIASLRQARRQLALLKSEGLGDAPVQIIVNRIEKKLFRAISLADAERVLGHAIAFSIANDFNLVSAALDQGLLLSEVKAGSKVLKDINEVVDGCEMLFNRSAG
jgi:pilus assembly protein CpaE